MATILRVEPLNVQQSNSELFVGADNVINGFAADSSETTITGTALTGGSRITAVKASVHRLIAIGSDAYVYWGKGGENPVASATKGIRLMAGIPETVAIPNGYLISAMTAS